MFLTKIVFINIKKFLFDESHFSYDKGNLPGHGSNSDIKRLFFKRSIMHYVIMHQQNSVITRHNCALLQKKNTGYKMKETWRADLRSQERSQRRDFFSMITSHFDGTFLVIAKLAQRFLYPHPSLMHGLLSLII